MTAVAERTMEAAATATSAGGERGPKRLGAAEVVVQAFKPVDVLVEGFAGGWPGH